MKENYYIAAALDLGLIDGYGISINDTNDTITKGDITIDVTPAVISRAVYLMHKKTIRIGRDSALNNTDWIALADNSSSQELKDTLYAYRQELRDCPSNLIEGDEDSFIFPEYPV
jgi:hypothetical protein